MQYITVVEDAPSITKLLEKLLSSKGYAVEAYETAEEGLEAMTRRPPDLLITDLRLPGMDGMELISQVRQDLILQDIPIIMLSAHADLDTRIQGLEEADDFLGKPFHSSELYARVTALLRRRKPKGLHGALERMGGMNVVLQMLAISYQEGVLVLDDGMTVHMKNAHIVAMNPMLEGDSTGMHTAEVLLKRQEGGFRFVPDMPIDQPQLKLSINELLLSAAKATDEQQAHEQQQSQPATSNEAASAAPTAQQPARPATRGTARPQPSPRSQQQASKQPMQQAGAANVAPTASGQTKKVASLEEELKHNAKGLVVLQNFAAAQQYMLSVGGMKSFEVRERFSNKHEKSCLVFENIMFVVVVLGLTMADLPANTELTVVA